MDKFIVVFGGAFNPVTNAHLSFAEQITNQYEVEKVVFLPVGNFYNKVELIEAKHRIAMLEDVCRTNPKFEVCDLEANSKVLLRTVESLDILCKKYSGKRLAFLMGTDNFKTMDTWYRLEELAQKYKFLVVERNEDSFNHILNSNEILSRNRENFVHVREAIRNDGSSTYVRGLIREGKSVRYLVPDEVYNYIELNNLYTD